MVKELTYKLPATIPFIPKSRAGNLKKDGFQEIVGFKFKDPNAPHFYRGEIYDIPHFTQGKFNLQTAKKFFNNFNETLLTKIQIAKGLI